MKIQSAKHIVATLLCLLLSWILIPISAWALDGTDSETSAAAMLSEEAADSDEGEEIDGNEEADGDDSVEEDSSESSASGQPEAVGASPAPVDLTPGEDEEAYEVEVDDDWPLIGDQVPVRLLGVGRNIDDVISSSWYSEDPSIVTVTSLDGKGINAVMSAEKPGFTRIYTNVMYYDSNLSRAAAGKFYKEIHVTASTSHPHDEDVQETEVHPVTIMVDHATKVQGEDDPVFTGTVEGLIDEGDLGEIRFVRMGDDEDPGIYEGVLTAEYDENDDYAVTVLLGDFTITPAYTLRWLDEDGTVLQEGLVALGEMPVYAGETPTKAADAWYTYEFSGWSPEVAAVTGPAEYKATYTQAAREYTVRFVDDDGTELQSGKVAYGETPEYKGETPEKAETGRSTYEFEGWTPEIAEVTGDATYTAVFKAVPKKATLTFDLGGGTLDGKTGTITIEANVGDTIKLPGAPVREGYTFKCWRGSEYAAGADYEVEGDHEFTAEWEKNVQPSPDKPDAKSATPATGDAMGTAVVLLAIAAIGSLIVLAACALRRKPGKGRHAR